MKKEISTEIKIKAAPEIVWKILVDFANYPNWNPFIQSLKGDVKEGKQIAVNIMGMNFKPIVLAYRPNKEFRWLGRLFFRGLFDGEHCFVITDNGDGTTLFRHSETFSGLLVRLFSRKLDSDTKKGFELMNNALKAQAEKALK